MTLLLIEPKQYQTQKTFRPSASLPSCCRCCHFYQFQGCRRGYCQKLGVSVCSHWRSCPFALPPFAPSCELGKEI